MRLGTSMRVQSSECFLKPTPSTNNFWKLSARHINILMIQIVPIHPSHPVLLQQNPSKLRAVITTKLVDLTDYTVQPCRFDLEEFFTRAEVNQSCLGSKRKVELLYRFHRYINNKFIFVCGSKNSSHNRIGTNQREAKICTH